MIDKKHIGKPHPRWEQLIRDFGWPFWMDSTRGPGFVREAGRKYLFQNPREHDDEWEIRAKTTEFVDYGRQQVEFIASRLTGMGFTASPFPEGTEMSSIGRQWTLFLQNCDRQNTPLDRWLLQQMHWSIGIGSCMVVVDLPKLNRPPSNLLEAEELGYFPYLQRVWPWEIINYSFKDSALVEIVIRERLEDPPNKEKPDAPENFSYLYYNVNDWERYKAGDKGVTDRLIDEGKHNLGEIPIVPFHSEEVLASEIYSRPVVENAHISALCLYNLSSRMENLSIEQGFALGYYEGDGTEKLDIGPNRFMAIPKGSSAPGYVSPGTDNIAAQGMYYDRRLGWLDMMTHQGVSSVTSSQMDVMQSGISKLMDQEDPTHFLREVGSRFVKPLRHLFRLIWKRIGEQKNTNDFVIQFPQRFALKDAGTVVQETQNKLDLFEGSVTARTLLLQHAADELLGRLATTKQLDIIRAELGNAQLLSPVPTPEEEEEFQATGL